MDIDKFDRRFGIFMLLSIISAILGMTLTGLIIYALYLLVTGQLI